MGGPIVGKTKLALFIRQRRKELGLTQMELALRLNMSQNNISRIESGENPYPRKIKIKQIAHALDCKVEELLHMIPQNSSHKPKTRLGRLIQARREELDMTQSGLATRLNKSTSYVRWVERGKKSYITPDLIDSWAEALELSTSPFKPFVRKPVSRYKPSKSALGAYIRSKREEREMTQEQLGKKIGVTRAAISLIELGETINFSQNRTAIFRLMNALKLNEEEKIKALSLRVKRKPRKLTRARSPLGTFLTKRRLEVGLTQKRLGQIIGVVGSEVSNIERGQSTPKPDKLRKILKSLGNPDVPVRLKKYLKGNR